MKMHIVVIRDRGADAFGVPNFVASVGGAVRSFADEVNRPAPENVVNRHPEDFELHVLGVYDDATASFELLERPELKAVGKDFIKG